MLTLLKVSMQVVSSVLVAKVIHSPSSLLISSLFSLTSATNSDNLSQNPRSIPKAAKDLKGAECCETLVLVSGTPIFGKITSFDTAPGPVCLVFQLVVFSALFDSHSETSFFLIFSI